MRFGVCCSIDEAQAVLAAGFGYVEVGASGFAGMEPDWDPGPYRDLPIGATNLFFDSRIRLFGPERTPYLGYVQRTVERAASIGVPTMVIGSGNARKAPPGMDGDAAFVQVAAEVAAIAAPHGITIAPESLNRTETNVGNDLASLAARLKAAGVAYTADSYHILFEWDVEGRRESLDDLMAEQIPILPAHVHIANLPRTGVDAADPMMASFAKRLKSLGYDRLVSLECGRSEIFDLSGALAALKALF